MIEHIGKRPDLGLDIWRDRTSGAVAATTPVPEHVGDPGAEQPIELPPGYVVDEGAVIRP